MRVWKTKIAYVLLVQCGIANAASPAPGAGQVFASNLILGDRQAAEAMVSGSILQSRVHPVDQNKDSISADDLFNIIDRCRMAGVWTESFSRYRASWLCAGMLLNLVVTQKGGRVEISDVQYLIDPVPAFVRESGSPISTSPVTEGH